jgi:hypothetical protein
MDASKTKKEASVKKAAMQRAKRFHVFILMKACSLNGRPLSRQLLHGVVHERPGT